MSNNAFQTAFNRMKSRVIKAKPWMRSHQKELMAAAIVLGSLVLIGGAVMISHSHPSHHTTHPASAPSKGYTPASTIKHDTPQATLVSAPALNRASQEYMKSGFAYYNQKDYGEAVNAFKEAADQDENNADARWWLGKSYQNLGKDSKACKQYGDYLELAPRGSHASDAKAAVKKCG